MDKMLCDMKFITMLNMVNGLDDVNMGLNVCGSTYINISNMLVFGLVHHHEYLL